MAAEESKPIKTLRISDADKRKLIDKINQISHQVSYEANRRRLRVDYNIGEVIVAVTHPSGSHVTFSVVPRNLSAHGLAFLHGRFVYADSACRIILPQLDGQHSTVIAKIVSCRHLGGVVHEVAVNFEQPINLAKYVALQPEDQKRMREEMNQSQITHALVDLSTGAGNHQRLWITPTTVSDNGLTFIHGLALPDGCECRLELFNEDHSLGVIEACVINSKPMGDSAVELTVAFNEPLADAPATPRPSFAAGVDAALDAAGRSPAHAAHAPLLTGNALVVDDFDSDRALFSLWLKKLGLGVFSASNMAQAIKLAHSESLDIVVTDLHLSPDSGLKLCRTLRAAGMNGIILVISAEDTDQMRAQSLAAGANGFLSKPCDPTDMQRAVRQLTRNGLGGQSAGGPIESSLAQDLDMVPLICDFVQSVGGHIEKLNDALARSQTTLLINTARMLKGAGGGYGFDALTNAAQIALNKLEAPNADPDAIRQAVNDLTAVARRLTAPGHTDNLGAL